MKLSEFLMSILVVARNVILGGNLVALSLARDPRIMIAYVSENLFFYKTYSSKRGIPQKNVYQILPANNAETIKLGNFGSGETWLHYTSSYASDIVSLCLICQILRPKRVFEIGTMRGYTALHLALNTPEDAKIYTLDLPKSGNTLSTLKATAMDTKHIEMYQHSAQYCFEGDVTAAKIECLFGDSAGFDFTPFHGGVDFFFIDGAHSYEYVRSDTLNALRCCHPGSVIAWHDFGRVGVNGVSKWIVELSKTHEIYSVPGGSLAFMVVK